jgi:dimethylargininase
MIRAITRQPSPEMADSCELTHVARTPIDMALAAQQHAAYVAALERRGATVTVLPPLAGHADGVFVEDPLIVLPELVIAARPGAVSRQSEGASLVAIAPTDRPHHVIEAPATIEGGDVLRVGRTLYIGHSSRTNRDGIAAITRAVTPHGYTIIAVPVPGALHLKTAITALAPDLFVANPAWIDVAHFGYAHIIAVDPSEPFAGNILPVGDAVITAAAHPRTTQRISEAGFPTHSVDIGEFARAEAGLTCMSLIWQA